MTFSGWRSLSKLCKLKVLNQTKSIQCVRAKHYVAAGVKDKAKSVLKEIEGNDVEQIRWAFPVLLSLYAALGKGEEVEPLWKLREGSPRHSISIAAIVAWLKLKNFDAAEAEFESLSKSVKLMTKHYTSLLRVYASNGMLSKGKDLVKQMAESGCRISPPTWDALVKLYVEAGEVEKADSILQKASQQNQMKPLFNSNMTLMEQYAKRGDIHNAEKTLYQMRRMVYTAQSRPSESLIQAYFKGKALAYRMRDQGTACSHRPCQEDCSLRSA